VLSPIGLDKIQDLYAATIRAGIDAAGGEENITTTDFEDLWYPEGWKGHVSDDISAGFGPNIYAEFSAPYHARIFEEFGGAACITAGRTRATLPTLHIHFRRAVWI